VTLGSAINDPGSADFGVWVSPNNLELYVNSFRSGGYGRWDIYVARRANANDPWGEAGNLGPGVNTTYSEALSCLSPDGLLLLFSQDFLTTAPRPGNYGLSDLWMARRASLSDPWQTPVNLGPTVNGPANESMPRISPDGRTLYFMSDRGGGWDNYQAPIVPVVDFNGDGKVDIQDLLRLIESWGKDDPSVDIGPMPWGDGKIDAADLEVLMNYWGQEVNDPTLIAYWKLDEASGTVATDSAGTNNGTLFGLPIWQPAGGKVKGALQLDGSDDYVTTDSVLDPAAGALSVFAWVKGGGPGQAILSQAGGANWLMAGASDGVLMTDLKSTGRQGKSLASTTVITDGRWHRVGFVWDGSNRILYVDGVEAARDTQAGLAASAGGLYIGAANTLAPGTFWSGLIDDVRIYDRVVKP